ncbi:xanthine dehydrogenase family protein molybdopterin-binding subunit [Fimbriimonas ginsengisoli]|uniref:Periplasmic aromatic aldehyde oxidoreductase, molybdenum binding subunit YagR n=1 Tax=Fimbriimonas ginsengisoli Gsoil 348 TaxID=661478 RepID=A0A068NR60_FIMGI|nr:xanthine dehydrogenase family protein molybdopterin-binding subunit [Fimbriimonas ginsengisoli]AIE84044.1 Periplasmic aromatic aldehyde oxidoreductase, molybdenum binding subunit YagR [Fimbriimonas ginsengisoli Gsoil 348]
MAQNEQKKGVVGQPLDRVDGKLKVTGGARYASEFEAPNLAHAVLVQSTIAKGRVTRIDTREAERSPGVVAVITFENMPKAARPTNPPGGQTIPLLSPDIKYSGQNLAVVVADTLEEAQYGAELVRVEYAAEPPDTDFEKHLDQAFAPRSARGNTKRGDFAANIGGATKKLDQVYRTPIEHHNPMEPHATVAVWGPDGLLAYDATQGVSNSQRNLAEEFGLPQDKVHVINPFVGGGFGCKGQAWPHSPIAAMAAKAVGRPVKLTLTRRQMFTSNGHRPPTHQKEVIGTDAGGKLVALQHQSVNHTSEADIFQEPTGSVVGMLYSCPNVEVEHKLVRVNVGAPTYQRAPGESTGSFAHETAMDELAWELGIDPVELRLRNYAEKDESEDKPFSSKSLRECYEQASAHFGWSRRNPKVGSMRDGNFLVGYGMATASYPANFWPAAAKARMLADGRVQIMCGTQDLGTGTYTILTQIAADGVGVHPSQVRVEIGDSFLPGAPVSGGSCSAASAGSAVQLAAEALRGAVIAYATGDANSPLGGLSAQDLDVKDGRVFSKANPSKGITYPEILAKYGKTVVEQQAFARPGIERGPSGPRTNQGQAQGDKGKGEGYSMHAFGAQFCEVHIDPDIRMVRVARWTGAFGIGKVLNEKTVRSQLQGGIVWGIGMALLEESLLDPRYGRFVNSNLAEYHVPVNKDVPPIEILLMDEKDSVVSPVGAKGAGEIGITGAAAAIGNAIYHATGKRVRDLPITLDKIL